MAKFLDENGLLYLWQQLKTKFAGKVDKETGKGLSTNDYTTTEKNKLAGIDESADANVIETIKVNSVDQTVTNKAVNITVPTKTSDITNDSGFITEEDIPDGAAASTTTPLMDGDASIGTQTTFARGDHRHPSDATKASLDSPDFTGTPTAPTAAKGTNTTQLATTEFVQEAMEDAQDALTFDNVPTVNSDNPVKSGGIYTALEAKLDSSTAASTYATTSDMNTALASKLDSTTAESTYVKKTDMSGVYKYKGSVASIQDLPATGNISGDVYDVQSTGMNYAWDGSKWDQLGMTLSIDSITNGEIDTIVAS